jgi:hypothetical protein
MQPFRYCSGLADTELLSPPMKNFYALFIALLLFTVKPVFSQIIAGSASAGLTISDPDVTLSASPSGTSVSAFIDLDCDGMADAEVYLYKGATVIDGGNTAYLFITNTDIQISRDTSAPGIVADYYNAGDTLTIPGAAYWTSDTAYRLGDFGCMACFGPASVSNKYIAYRNISSSQTGWIKISFDLFDSGSTTSPVTLSMPEVLSPCVITAIPSIGPGTGSATCGVFNYNYTVYPTCSGMCDGAIYITGLSGGTPPYSYDWSGSPTGDGTSTISNLCAGNYSVEITDAGGNTCTEIFEITSPPPVVLSVTTTPASCFGTCDGTACVNISGGTGPFYYLWMPGGSTTACLTNICAGTYTVCVTDNNGCTVCTTATVTQPTALSLTSTTTPASCLSCCDGNIQLIPSGGNPAYSYTFSPGGYIPPGTFCPGEYLGCATDVNGCMVCDSITLGSGPETDACGVFLYSYTTSDPSCAGSCDGTISITSLSGGTGSYAYNWFPGTPTGEGSTSVSNLCGGSYYVNISDSGGNSCNAFFYLTEPSAITFSVISTNVSCYGGTDGSACITGVSGGTPPYTYTWVPTGGPALCAYGLPAGAFMVCVTDANGCMTCLPFTITEPPQLVISMMVTNVSCFGDCDVSICPVVSGGTPLYAYALSN